MLKNPYSPVFGGRPSTFFGRKELLARFSLALADPSSEDRALFITGTRGSGKTALIEQLSSMASQKGWLVVDLVPNNTVPSLLHRLAGYTEKTTTLAPQVSVSVLGSGGSLSGHSTSRTERPDEADLPPLFLETCKRHPKGVMVTIDEVQKVPEEDMSLVCNAFQLASRKGHNAILAVDGLPYAHGAIIRYEGCTYMRRAHHIKLGLLSREDAVRALEEGAAQNPGFQIPQDQMADLLRASFGHPYMLQLLGYYLIGVVNEGSHTLPYETTPDDTREALELATLAYESRSLQPLVAELTSAEQSYLASMAKALDSSRTARTAEIAALMGKEPSSVSYVRESLVNKGLVLPAGHGLLVFNVPYLASYILKDNGEGATLRRVREWGV